MDSVKIGDQIWSLNNSTLKTFSNGEEIHHSTSKVENGQFPQGVEIMKERILVLQIILKIK